MSEAMDAANLVYQDSQTGIFDFYARGMKFIYNDYQMGIDAVALAVNEAQLIFDGARNDLEVLRATVHLDLLLIDQLSSKFPVVLHEIYFKGSTDDRQVAFKCDLSVMNKEKHFEFVYDLDHPA